MAERWFFAVWPDPIAREALAEQLGTLAPPGARRTHPLDLHLTLVFLGELAPERLGCVEAAADELRAVAFPVRIERTGWFARSRVFWCGPSATPQPLASLVASLQGRLAACGIPPDPRPLRPHVTLARNVPRRPETRPAAPVEWTVREFALAAGRSGAVPRYEVRRRWRLAEASGELGAPG